LNDRGFSFIKPVDEDARKSANTQFNQHDDKDWSYSPAGIIFYQRINYGKAKQILRLKILLTSIMPKHTGKTVKEIKHDIEAVK